MKISLFSNIVLTKIKGIGKGSSESLKTEGITTIEELLDDDPENLSSKISGISLKKVSEWQTNARVLLKT